MASRAIKDMDEQLQVKYAVFAAKMSEAGLPFILTCTLRTPAEQVALYAQGRKSLTEVNSLRKVAGLGAVTEEENKKQVTWVTTSKHFPNSRGKSVAFDIAICKNGIPTWDVKADVDRDGVADYEEAARIGRVIGLKCGADFQKKDYAHFELA